MNSEHPFSATNTPEIWSEVQISLQSKVAIREWLTDYS